MHRFPVWLCKVINKLSASWNTRISVRTAQGVETSEVIIFRRGLPQGDDLRGSSRSVKESLRQLVGSGRCNSVLRKMQKAVISSSLNIAMACKVLSD